MEADGGKVEVQVEDNAAGNAVQADREERMSTERPLRKRRRLQTSDGASLDGSYSSGGEIYAEETDAHRGASLDTARPLNTGCTGDCEHASGQLVEGYTSCKGSGDITGSGQEEEASRNNNTTSEDPASAGSDETTAGCSSPSFISPTESPNDKVEPDTANRTNSKRSKLRSLLELSRCRNVANLLRKAEHGLVKTSPAALGPLMLKKQKTLETTKWIYRPDSKTRVIALAISHQGNRIVTGSGCGYVQYLNLPCVYDPDAPGFPWTTQNHRSWVSDVAFNKSGRVVVSAGNDGLLIAISALSGCMTGKLSACGTHNVIPVTGVDVRGNTEVASTTKNGSLQISTLFSDGTLKLLNSVSEAHKGVARHVRWCPDTSSMLSTCGSDGYLRVFDVRSMKKYGCAMIETPGCYRQTCNTVDWHLLDHSILLTSGYAGQVFIHDLRRPGKPLCIIGKTNLGHYNSSGHGCHRQSAFYLDGESVLAGHVEKNGLAQYATRTGEILYNDLSLPSLTIAVHHPSRTVVTCTDHTDELYVMEPYEA